MQLGPATAAPIPERHATTDPNMDAPKDKPEQQRIGSKPLVPNLPGRPGPQRYLHRFEIPETGHDQSNRQANTNLNDGANTGCNRASLLIVGDLARWRTEPELDAWSSY